MDKVWISSEKQMASITMYSFTESGFSFSSSHLARLQINRCYTEIGFVSLGMAIKVGKSKTLGAK